MKMNIKISKAMWFVFDCAGILSVFALSWFLIIYVYAFFLKAELNPPLTSKQEMAIIEMARSIEKEDTRSEQFIRDSKEK